MAKNAYLKKNKKKTIVIVGAGYVGLPLAIAFAKSFTVICFDINQTRIKELKQGYDSNKQHIKIEILQKKLNFTNDKKFIKDKDYYIITVPTPIDKSNYPDLSMLKEASILVGKSIKKGSVIIYESTTYPGCTEEICIPLIEKYSNFKTDDNFFVAYSPERVNPGDKVNTLNSITKIVGSNNQILTKTLKDLYKNICKEVYCVDSIKIAESAKVIENIQRDVNIALVNELSVLFNLLNIPTNEVLLAASTKWNFHYYKPGIVGGHCIGIDPYYLSYLAEQKKYFPQLILAGRRFNESMAKYIVDQSVKLLVNNNISPSRAKIAILGFAFKENINDIRNTKVFDIIEELKKWNCKYFVFDNQVSKKEVKKIYNIKIFDFKQLKKFKFDAIMLAVSHKDFIKPIKYFDKFYKNKNNKLIIDIKNIFSNKILKNNKYKFFTL